MQATPVRPSREVRIEVDGVIYWLRSYDEARVAVVVGPPEWDHDAVPAVAEAVECELDVRLYGTSWRLVAGDDEVLNLVTFSGFDDSGLLGATWDDVPAVMASWLQPTG